MSKRDRRSKVLRQDPHFLRNEYNGECKYDIPLLDNCSVHEENLELISFKNIRPNDYANLDKTVHFFSDDPYIDKAYDRPEVTVERIAQYKYVLTPDFSLLTDMPIWKQIDNVARSRWCGKFWQEMGLTVIPTVSWSTPQSYEFAFLGLPQGTAVAVSTLSVRSGKTERALFLAGYNELITRIEPKRVYCYSKPFPEMGDEVVWIDYLRTTRRSS